MKSSNKISVISLFPQVLNNYLNESLLKRAQQRGLLSFRLIQLRDFSKDKHRNVDAKPYGGGEGMVLRPDVLYAAWLEAKNKSPKAKTILLSPQGRLLTAKYSERLARVVERRGIIFVCGHYEGVDQRFIDACVDEELSIGNYVLTGGEVACLVTIDALARFIPGVVGNDRSVPHDSLQDGLLKYPQFTKPAVFEVKGKEHRIPEVLLTGNHQKIETFRQLEKRRVTREKRPSLYQRWLRRQEQKK